MNSECHIAKLTLDDMISFEIDKINIETGTDLTLEKLKSNRVEYRLMSMRAWTVFYDEMSLEIEH